MEPEGILYLFIIVMVYFAPSLIANARKHQNLAGVAILNVLLGWTGIFWIAALIWAVHNKNAD